MRGEAWRRRVRAEGARLVRYGIDPVTVLFLCQCDVLHHCTPCVLSLVAQDSQHTPTRGNVRFQTYRIFVCNITPLTPTRVPTSRLHHGLPQPAATHIAQSDRPSLEQRPARCWQRRVHPPGTHSTRRGLSSPSRSGTPQPPGLSIEPPGRASPPAGKEGATSASFSTGLGLEQRI